jgi:predicted O-methyltransferase YrrM
MSDWHKTFLGVRQQHNYMLYQFIDKALRHEPIERFVEIGTGGGALSVVLGLHAVNRGTRLLTLDTLVRKGKPMLDNVFDALEIEFVQEDCFNNVERILKHIDGKPCFFFCDGGNKIKEFNTFAPLLPVGSIIAAHDYETKELRAADIEEVARGLTPVLEEYWREEKFNIRTCFW